MISGLVERIIKRNEVLPPTARTMGELEANGLRALAERLERAESAILEFSKAYAEPLGKGWSARHTAARSALFEIAGEIAERAR